ncbi:MAG TPA: hypothetical protein VJX47_06385 [Candidatus Sulfotelmatobacter sp.]|nr:hypothetical protein [Candidatus Sulfotelmatobacter sp.]
MNILSPEVDAAINVGGRRVGKKFATVFYIPKIDRDDEQGGRDRVWDYVSDCVQATRLKLLTTHKAQFDALREDERPAYAQKLATATGWELIRPARKENPLSGLPDECEAGSGDDNPHVPACDDVSLAHKGHRPDWIRIHEFEAEVIAAIDAQKTATLTGETSETLYERATRLLGEDAEWFWSYHFNLVMYTQRSGHRIARTQAERARFSRLKRKIGAPSRLVLLGRKSTTNQCSTEGKGMTKNSSPKTPAFALQQFQKSNVKLLCFSCGAVRAISQVIEVQQKPASYISTCTLECGHSRDLEIAITRSEVDEATLRANEGRATEEADERPQSQVGPEAQFGPFVNQGLGFNETTAASAATTN